MLFFEELLSFIPGIRASKRKTPDSFEGAKPTHSPPKRNRTIEAVKEPAYSPEVDAGLARSVPKQQLLAPSAKQQQQQPVQPQVPSLARAQGQQHPINLFRQFSSPGAAQQPHGMSPSVCYFASGQPPCQPHRTPLRPSSTAQLPASHTKQRAEQHTRTAAAAASRSRSYTNQQRRLPAAAANQAATATASFGGAAVAIFGSEIAGLLVTSDMRQRSSYKAAARGFHPEQLVQQQLMSDWQQDKLGAAAGGSEVAATRQQQQCLQDNLRTSPASAQQLSFAGAMALAAPALGMGLLPVSQPASLQLVTQSEQRLQEEIQEQQARFEKCKQRDESFNSELKQLQRDNARALHLSPGYQTNPAMHGALLQMQQQAVQIRSQRLQRDAALLQQQQQAYGGLDRNAGPRSGQKMAELKLLKREYEQQQQQQQWRAASPAVPSELDKEQQQQGEESDDVICLDDSDSEPADEQQQQQYGVQQAASKARDNEYEGDELKTIEGAAESEASVAVDAAAAAIGALEIFWTGPRSNWTPSPQEWQRYEAAMGAGIDDEVLASHQRACIDLTREVLQCMREAEWLNDEVMNFYVALMQDRDTAMRGRKGALRCHFFSTFFAKSLIKNGYKSVQRWTRLAKLNQAGQVSDNVLHLDRIIMPIHEGIHWTAAMIDLKHKRFVFFDSLMGTNRQAIAALKRWVVDEAKDKLNETWDTSDWPEFYPKDIPKQRNGCDCGVFSLLFCNRLGLGRSFDFIQDDLLVNARVKVTCELLDKRLKVSQ